MNIKKLFNRVALLGAGTLLVLGSTVTAFAENGGISVGVNASASAAVSPAGVGAGVGLKASAAVVALVGKAQTRADQEITRRVNALNALSARVNAMVRLSAGEKSNLSSTISSQVSLMNTLQAQIAADAAANSTTSLKADIQSITKAYRIFALIIPQGAVAAAADRVMTVSADLATIAGKLQTRITEAQSSGHTMDASVTLLADMNAKIADANTQSQAAVTETASLQPDNGDATLMASNTAALKDARTKIKAAQQDLITARQDAGTIVKTLVSLDVSVSASSSATVTP